MKLFTLLFAAILWSGISYSQTSKSDTAKQDLNKELLVVEAACGQCKLGLTGSDCDLAIRIKDSAYFVDGTHIDNHGDAHAKDGFCNAVRKAAVQGQIINGRFKATYFKLIKDKAEH